MTGPFEGFEGASGSMAWRDDGSEARATWGSGGPRPAAHLEEDEAPAAADDPVAEFPPAAAAARCPPGPGPAPPEALWPESAIATKAVEGRGWCGVWRAMCWQVASGRKRVWRPDRDSPTAAALSMTEARS